MLNIQTNKNMTNSIKLTEITTDQAINHSRNNYNPYEWEKQINQINQAFDYVKFYEIGDEVYSIFNAQGANYIIKLEFSHSINNGGFKTFILKNNELIKYPLKISKSKDDMDLAKALSNEGLILANVYLNI